MMYLKKALVIFITFFAHSITKAYVRPFFAQNQTSPSNTFFAPQKSAEPITKKLPKVYVVIKMDQNNAEHLKMYAANLNAKFSEYGIETETLLLEKAFEGTIYQVADKIGAAYILYVNQTTPAKKNADPESLFDVLSFDLNDSYCWKEVAFQLNFNIRKEESVTNANSFILKKFIEGLES